MKCPTCGGLIVEDQWDLTKRKCILCGRDPDKLKNPDCDKEKKMEEKIKLCERCHQPFPATNEYFSKNKAASDGLEYSCKDCKKKAQQGYRDKKTKSRKSTSRDFFPHALKSVKSDPLHKSHNDPITTATPEEIIKALRKGVAAEIVKMIQEAFA
jgi:hypothetical protein